MSLVRITGMVLIAAALSSVAHARKKDPAFATSADDPVLRARIVALGPNIDPDEARRVAEIAYTTGRDLKKEWRVVWPPGVENFRGKTAQRTSGLSFTVGDCSDVM